MILEQTNALFLKLGPWIEVKAFGSLAVGAVVVIVALQLTLYCRKRR